MKLATLSLLAGAVLTGCSSDEFIARDYVVNDLGGSNQTLIGANGTIRIDNVTAFRLEEPFIFVEADGRYDGGRASQQPCSYYLIDMRNQRMVRAKSESRGSRLFAAEMAMGAKIIMDRSCVAKAAKRAAGRA